MVFLLINLLRAFIIIIFSAYNIKLILIRIGNKRVALSSYNNGKMSIRDDKVMLIITALVVLTS